MGLSSMYGGSGQTVYFLTLGFRRQPEVVWAELIWGGASDTLDAVEREIKAILRKKSKTATF
jgi:hypothetical protein